MDQKALEGMLDDQPNTYTRGLAPPEALVVGALLNRQNRMIRAILAPDPAPAQAAPARCEICDWPLVDDPEKGCTADNCSYRPDDRAEQLRIAERRAQVGARKAPAQAADGAADAEALVHERTLFSPTLDAAARGEDPQIEAVVAVLVTSAWPSLSRAQQRRVLRAAIDRNARPAEVTEGMLEAAKRAADRKGFRLDTVIHCNRIDATVDDAWTAALQAALSAGKEGA